MGPEASEPRRWVRPVLLLMVLWGLSVVPSGPLVALPLLALLVFLPRPQYRTALIAGLAAAMIGFGGLGDGISFLVRGWAVVVGLSFVAATWVMPDHSFVNRGLVALVAAVGLSAAMFLSGWIDWGVVDWMMAERLQQAGAVLLESIRQLSEGGLTAAPTMMETVERVIRWQQSLYPGTLAVSTLCALAVAWWLYVRWAQGSDRGLGPLRDFRFNDQLVWIVVAGVALVLWSSADGLGRAGANVLVLMAALYLLRGAAIVVFLTGGVSLGGAALALLGLAMLPQVMVGGAVTLGLSDTWLDIRGRARAVIES